MVKSDVVTGQRRLRLTDEAGYKHQLSVDAADLKQIAIDLFVGMEARKREGRRSFGSLAEDWLGRVAKSRVAPDNEKRHVRHMSELLSLCEGELTKRAIDVAFAKLAAPAGPLAPASLNKLRGTGRQIIRDAQANAEWEGVNPFDLVRRFAERDAVYDTLSREEAARLLPHLRPDRRRLVRAMLLVGMRPGEAFALRKADLDFKRLLMRIRRSGQRDETKTGKEREFPMPSALIEDLRDSCEKSPNELVFPGLDGKQESKNTRLGLMLRRAMGRAGIVMGFRYRCRGAECDFDEVRASAVRELFYCSRCERAQLRCMPVPRALRFYDLRHSAATMLRDAGCDPLVIQIVLGHAATNTTDRWYTHLSEEYVRAELNKLQLEAASTTE